MERKQDWPLASNADVETTSVRLIAMQKLTAVPMTTRAQGGDTYRRRTLWLMHQNFPKSNSPLRFPALPEESYYIDRRNIV